ncbi:BON domain-containing protein [soil metagenome]
MKSDSQLKKDVLEELKWEPSVSATHVGVEVSDGIVTLAGHVGSYAEKYHAERAAQRVEGVRALAVEMDVRLPGGLSLRNDADIARSVETALEWMTDLPRGGVKVSVESGWITLTGEVDFDYQRRAATRGVRYLMGVTGVSDQITLAPQTITQGDVKTSIEGALHRRARADARDIVVDVDGTQVTLSGHVSSWTEAEVARHSAWNTRGVQSVVDKLTVSY